MRANGGAPIGASDTVKLDYVLIVQPKPQERDDPLDAPRGEFIGPICEASIDPEEP
jgi:hypothetical protein